MIPQPRIRHQLSRRYTKLMWLSYCMGLCTGILFIAFIEFARKVGW